MNGNFNNINQETFQSPGWWIVQRILFVFVTDSKMLDSLDRILGMNTQSVSNSDDVMQQALVSTKSIRFVMVFCKLIFICKMIALEVLYCK